MSGASAEVNTELAVKVLSGKPCRLRVLEDGDFFGIPIEKGFECDGQSWVIGEQRAMWSAVGHDLVYYYNGRIPGVEKEYTRAEADALFRRGLILCGVSQTQAWVRWSGVRLFGWRAWNDHAKAWARGERRMGKRLLTSSPTIGLVCAVSLLLTGCTGVGRITKNLSEDGAVVVLTLGTPWGTQKVVRVGETTNRVEVTPEGRVLVNGHLAGGANGKRDEIE